MPTDTSVEFTLSIWRDFVPSRPIAFVTDEEARQVFDADSILQEKIYSWRAREDVFAGILDDETRRGLHERLVEQLSDSKDPSERRLEVLQGFVDASQKAIVAGQVRPVPSKSRTSGEFETEELDQIEVNSLLALTIHLKWIIACFDKRPGISVLVR